MVAVTALRYGAELFFAAARILRWDQPYARCHVAPGAELPCIPDDGEMGVAVMSPTPGIVTSRRLASLLRHQAFNSFSIFPIPQSGGACCHSSRDEE